MAGAYVELFELARGGIGAVSLVVRRGRGFERLYALKRLHPHLRDDDSFRTMFVDEARIAGLLRHPNVVSVLDLDEDEHGPFLVMDFVDGVSVAGLLRSLHEGELLPIPMCLAIVQQAARGLHAAHELRAHDGSHLRLIHRDVSPQNLLVGFDGVVRVTDFGIAKALGRDTHTTTGLLKGKAGYMSPEQLRFEQVDRRSDLFSLGVVLFELATGRRLYVPRGEMSAPARILRDPVPDVSEHRRDADPELVELLFDLLAKEAEHRPATAQDVVDRIDAHLGAEELREGTVALERFVEERFGALREERNGRVRAALANVTDPPAEKPRRALPWIAGIGLAGAAAALALSWGLSGERPEEPPRVHATPAPVDASSAAPDAPRPARERDAGTAARDAGLDAAADRERPPRRRPPRRARERGSDWWGW